LRKTAIAGALAQWVHEPGALIDTPVVAQRCAA